MTAGAVDRDVAGALTRAGVYGLLGRAFAYPTPDALAGLAERAEALAKAPALAEGLRLRVAALAAEARRADPAALAEEHVFLFDRQATCPPYEGAFGPTPPWSAGRATHLADVAGFFAAFGVQPAAGRPDAEDHVAAELDFLGVLSAKEAFARAEGLEAELEVTRKAVLDFLGDHLGRWADAFARGVTEASPQPFYRVAAETLAAWVAGEVERVGAGPVAVERGGPDPLQADDFTCPMAGPPAGEAAPPA
jgi:TorA maturation chaperone TorD